MSNKVKLKKYLVSSLTAGVLILLGFLALNIYGYHVYTEHFNQKLNAVINEVRANYPEVTETELIGILNSEASDDTSILGKYGIDPEETSVIMENEKAFHLLLLGTAALTVLAVALLLLIFIRYDKRRARDISEITEIIGQINKRNYELHIDSVSEDELSILKDEIYKTTVMLREAADHSMQDKRNLKQSLEDISHQIKTPLTSILVMLDNMIDDPDMDAQVRDEFLRSIKRDTMNINFFVQAILKLSRFDSNTIRFIKEETDLGDVIKDSVRNVSALCDLKNVAVETSGEDSVKIVCDRKWQTEAVTNILKNCIDHSHAGGRVQVFLSRNNVYSMILICDHGDGISAKDLPHVFERFYKGENSSMDSIGIGLALSRSIIEEDNGTVSVESDSDGTRFRIKYYTL